MAEWQTQSVKFNSQGLDLIHPLDQIPENAYPFFSNAATVYEGSLTSRPGLVRYRYISIDEQIHTVWVVEGRMFVGIGQFIYMDVSGTLLPLPIFLPQNTTGWTGSGGVISHVEFRPAWANQSYTYVTDGQQMARIDLSGNVRGMGILPPHQTWPTADTRIAIATGLTMAQGGNLDSTTGVPYDWRYTYYVSELGIESNPCPVGDALDTATDQNDVAGTYFTNGLATMNLYYSPDDQVDRIRLYRRGGTLFDWYRVKDIPNLKTFGTYGDPSTWIFQTTDGESDDSVGQNEILSEENDKPVTSYDSDVQDATQATPLKILFGPLSGKWIFGLGDPYRPGNLYWMNAWQPDCCSSLNNLEITSPDEPLMNGFIHNGKAYVASTKNVYAIFPNMSGDTQFVTLPTSAGNGMWGRYGIAVGPRVWYLSQTGIFEFQDGAAQNITEDSFIRPIFRVWPSTPGGINTHPTIDWDPDRKDLFRMEYQEPFLYFMYPAKDVDTQENIIQTMRYHIYAKRWEPWNVHLGTVASKLIVPYWDVNARTMYFGSSEGRIYNLVDNQKDDHDPLVEGSGNPIQVNISTAFFDQDGPRAQKIYGDCFIEYNSNGVNNIRVTPYINEDPNNGLNPVLLPEVTGRGRAIIPVRTLAGTSGVLARSISFNFYWACSEGYPEIHELNISYLPRVDETTVRETDWDDGGYPGPKWVRGVILDADLMGNDKSFYVQYIRDGVDAATPADFGSIGPNTIFHIDDFPGQDRRQQNSLSWPVFRATRMRIISTDTDPWMVYGVNWLFEKEPEQIARWDGMGWEDLDWPYEKYIKAVSVECDTMGQDKALSLYIDGVNTAVDSFTVNTAGRSIVMQKFNNVLARTVKLIATDNNSGYLYKINWVWDREPVRITRWETQETTFQSKGYHYIREILVGVRCWSIICVDIWADLGDGSFNYQFPRKYIWSTNGERQKPKVEVEPIKGKNFKFLFTSELPFKLYLEDSEVRVKEWNVDLGWKAYQLPFEGGVENP